MTRTITTVLVSLMLFGASCGGGGDSAIDEAGDETTSTTAPADNDDTSTTIDGSSDTTNPSSEQTENDDGAGSAAIYDEPLPNGFEVVAFPAGPVGHDPTPDAPNELAHIGAMFGDTVGVVLGDRRSADAAMFGHLDRDAAESTPELVIASMGSQLSYGAEVMRVVEAYAKLGAESGFDATMDEYWRVRAEAAGQSAEAFESAFELLADAVDFDRVGLVCVAEFVFDNDDNCADSSEAQALVDELKALNEQFEFHPELDDFDDQLPRLELSDEGGAEFSLCLVWDVITDMMAPAQVEIFDGFIDDTFLDTLFLGRSECRHQAGLDEDAVWDHGPGRQAFAAVYEAIVAAGAEAPFDEAFYDSYEDMTPEEYAAGERASIVALADAAHSSASAELESVAEPMARLGLASIAYASQGEVWVKGLMAVATADEAYPDDLHERIAVAVGCVEFADSGIEACTIDQVATLDSLRQFEMRDGAMSFATAVDWEDVAEELALCELWIDALEAVDDTTADKVDFQIEQFGLDEVYGLDDCRTGRGDTAKDTTG